MHWGLKEWTYPSLCLQGGSNITGSCLNNEYLQLRYVNGVKCLLQQTTFSIFGVFPTFIGYHLLNYFSNNSVLCFLQFLHWERGLVLHSEPRCDWTHSGIWSIQQLLGRSEQTLLLCIDLLSHYNIFFLQVIVINLHVIQQVFFSLCSFQGRDRLRLSLGEKAPTLVPVSQVMMCMNCTSDFSLTLRRHHCHGCGRVSHTQNKHGAP